MRRGRMVTRNHMPVWKDRRTKRYAEDPEYRERMQERGRRFYAAHKEEILERKRHKYATDPEYRAKRLASQSRARRAHVLKYKYGMSLLEYELRLALQNGACAICKKKPKRLLCVD